MNYYAELMNLVHKLGLNLKTMYYYDSVLRTDMKDTLILHNTSDGRGNLIAKLSEYAEYPYNTKQSIFKALKAVQDYESWK